MKKLVLLILLFFVITISAQKEANFWYFGRKAGINFNTNPPIATKDGKLETLEGCSSFSDSDGNLLFYVGAPNTDNNRLTVWDKNHNVMTYSDGRPGNNLLGNTSSTQSAMIIPKPLSTNIYYLFTLDDGTDRFQNSNGDYVITEEGKGLNLYTIDTSGGLGKIVEGPVDLSDGLFNSWTEKVAAVKGSECNTFWIVSKVNNLFYAYKVDENGVSLTPVISTVSNYTSAENNTSRGYLKLSPDGSKLAIANQYGNQIGTKELLLYSFNNDSGTVTNDGISLLPNINDGQAYGVEFSRTSKKLYVTTTSDFRGNLEANPSVYKLFQFDLTSLNIPNTKYKIHEQEGFRGALQLGPDGKIYATIPLAYNDADGDATFLSAIENPEADAADVIFTENAIDLGGRFATQGLPPFIASLLLPIEIVDADNNSVINNQNLEFCAGQDKVIESETLTGTDVTYEWTFDDGITASVIQDTKNLVLNNIVTSDSGKYTLVVQLTDICTNVINFEAVFNLKVNPLPTLNPILYQQCDFDTDPNDFIANFNLAAQESKIYSGSDPVTIDFFETTDTSFSFPLSKNDYRNSTSTSPVNGNHTLVVRVTNDATNCAGTQEIELKVNPSGIDSYPDIYTCELDLNDKIPNSRNSIGTANSFYNFDDKTSDIIVNSSGALNEDTHEFSYFRTSEDATLQRDEIVAPYEDDLFENRAILFVRISLKNSNLCESVGEFSIIIQERPIPQGSVNTTLLCLNNPINFPQTITVDLDANTGFLDDTYTWYLNGSLLSNETKAILKANKGGEYSVITSRFYLNNIANSADDISCTGYNTFTVLASNIARIETFSFVEDENNFTDNTFTVLAVGDGNYEFALKNDDKNTTTLFQNEPIFENIQGGIYTIIVRDKNGCSPNVTLQVSALQFPKFFTPNGDGKNDTWAIKGANNTFYSKSFIQIFNRYGKLVAEPTLDGIGWDGTNNGRILSSDDYWYNITLTPTDPSKPTINKIGNFSLLRR
jgi:gliding motility-associated-like protein